MGLGFIKFRVYRVWDSCLGLRVRDLGFKVWVWFFGFLGGVDGPIDWGLGMRFHDKS